jgi:hypothetical protein
MSRSKLIKVVCIKASRGNKGVGIHEPGTKGEWHQAFSINKPYSLPESMAKELIKDGFMKEIKKGGRENVKD